MVLSVCFGEFKTGAAKLAIEANVKNIPVCINEAYEIYPPHRRLPKTMGMRNSLSIQFGEPIIAGECNEEQITSLIREKITEMKAVKK